MGWKGFLWGSILGGLRGSLAGSLVGGFVGSFIENRFFGGGPRASASRPYGRRAGGFYQDLSDTRRTRIFCASAAAMLAKLAKADGHVSRSEIASVELAFERLGFDTRTRAYAIGVFRKAKDDAHTIYEYAAEFAAVVQSVQLRELFYELLWDLACADGFVSSAELEILRQITATLGVRLELYLYFWRTRLRNAGGAGYGRDAAPPRDALAEAYATLGIDASCSDEEAKKAYRDLAKKNHPDALRAQGLPDAMVAKANEKMGRINAAWTAVKEARGL